MTILLPIILLILLLIINITTTCKRGGVNIGRLTNEISRDYKNATEVIWNKDSPHHMHVRYGDDATYNIDIPDDYPFKQVSVNGWKVFSDDVQKRVIDSINLLRESSKILIYCHSEPVTIHTPNKNKISTSDRSDLQHHWFNDVIYEQAINAGIDDPTKALVLCVDTNEQIKYVVSESTTSNTPSVTKIKYQKERVKEADGFSDEFITNNIDMFHTIAVPDCDGSWWKDNNVSSWVEKIKHIVDMLKPGGTLVASKFAGSDSTQWRMPEETPLAATEKELAEQVAKSLRETNMFEYVNVRSFTHISKITELPEVEYKMWYVEMKKNTCTYH